MTRIIFEVPKQVIGDFSDKLAYHEFKNTIVGTNDQDEIEIEVLYEKDDVEEIRELEDFLEELKDDLESKEESEEEDDEHGEEESQH